MAAGIISLLLASVDWDAAALLRVGEDDSATAAYIEEQLGDVFRVPDSGHDGKFFFIQAHDPLLLNPGEHAEAIDRPVYRSQRMLYPLLASAGGLFGGWGVVWGLIVVNVAAIGLGTWATSRLALALGASPWLGLAFVLNPGMIFELIIDGAGALSWALAVLGMWLIVSSNYKGGVVAVALAVLAREAMILVAIGLAVRLWKSDRPKAVGIVAWPAVAALLWGGWVRLRLGVPLLTSQSEEIGLPFVGLAQAVGRWIDQPGRNRLFGLVVIALLLVAFVQAVRRPSFVSYSALGFVVMAPLLTGQVWLNYFDISRAVAPVFTTFALAMFTPGSVEAAGDGERFDDG